MDFNDGCATPFAADAHKRVNYSYGLLLGVSEFRTEQDYFLEKHRRHARSLHGYGTVAGLAVSVRDTVNGPEIRVSPGLAIDPQGREVCVPETQCALLDRWLQQRLPSGDLSPPVDGSPPSQVTAYVTLCYRECETDKVPIPVGPCHSLDKSSVASRIQDAFELRLTDAPPAQIEEDAILRLATIMARVSVGTGPGALTTPDALIAEIRALAPDASPPAVSGSPPLDFVLDPQYAAAIVRAALRVFVTEVRPMLVPEGGGCLDGPRDTSCVLLAQLDFDIQDVGGVPQVLGAVQITQDDRPLLVQTRLLQEALLAGGSRLGSAPFPGPVAYQLAAAGMLRGDGTPDGPVLNNPSVVSVANGEIVFAFDGYQQPDGTFQYVVKVQAVSAPPVTPVPTVRLVEFRPAGFAVRVTRGNAAVSAANIASIAFMVEVSRIE